MKKILATLFTLAFGVSLFAQKQESATPVKSSVNDQEIRKETEALTIKYNLSADQAKQMYTIQQRKAKNLADIAPLQTSDPALYRSKVKNVQTGTLASIRRILRSKDQVDLFEKTKSEIRVLQSKKQKELAAKKATREEIENALLAIYAE
ncbi:MAG: hypothetical protein SFV22_19600 [Saprospiraceae bacterium]|nr:hypothetical protein [Saprospiraceae bacterium]